MNAINYIKDLRKRVGSPYVYGAKQNKEYDKITTHKEIIALQNMYGSCYVWDSDINKCGSTCCDCSGFVDYLFQKGYNSTMLFNNASNIINIRKVNGKLNKSKLYNVPIGAILWCKGHVGVFIGYKGKVPYYIAQDGSRNNCRINKLSDSPFTHALYNIKGYDIEYYTPTAFKTIKKVTAYTTRQAKVVKRTYSKGKKVNAVFRLNNYVLVRGYSYNRDCWLSIRDLVEVK